MDQAWRSFAVYARKRTGQAVLEAAEILNVGSSSGQDVHMDIDDPAQEVRSQLSNALHLFIQAEVQYNLGRASHQIFYTTQAIGYYRTSLSSLKQVEIELDIFKSRIERTSGIASDAAGGPESKLLEHLTVQSISLRNRTAYALSTLHKQVGETQESRAVVLENIVF